MQALTDRVRDWRRRGGVERIDGQEIHVFRHEGEGALLLLLHGFPGALVRGL